MSLGLIGTKLGMTRVFEEDGMSVPVTVVGIEPHRILKLKSVSKDGYSAVAVTTGSVKSAKLSAPLRGEFEQFGVNPGRGVWEFRVTEVEADTYKVGDTIDITLFNEGQKVDVKGVSIGKGFTGVMKRWGFGGGRATHGNSKAHRKPGSIGQNQTPSRVFPGKKMAGHSGDAMRVQQNLEIVRIDPERQLMLIKGSVPGSRQSDIIVTKAVKQKR